ncbi:VanZ family protein [Paenibacillus ginsengihumi]|uniref:VanZ family protein n=1 Tax=Paenibacillus ginsengihumi TaxID=431596 RepID=UPI000382D0E7|nr:VanZ family protein [Paenibacillus ginsengihumi]
MEGISTERERHESSAGLDEIHQSFTAGRTPLALDVLLDATGAAAGIILCSAIARRRSKRGVPA